MPALIAAGLAAAAYAGSGMMASKKAKGQRRRYGRRLKRAIGATEAIQGRSLSQQEALARQATQQQLGGFDAARRETARLGRSAKRSALDRETQLGARASQSLANRGLGSSTIGANLQRGIASDTNRLMADVDEGMAGRFGDLAIGRGGVEAAGTQRLGQIAGQRGDLFANLAQMGIMRDLYGSSPWGGGAALPEREASTGQNLLGGFQYGLGTYMGMGGFGGGGMGGGQMGGMDPEMLMYLFDQQQNGSGHDLLYGPYQANGTY